MDFCFHFDRMNLWPSSEFQSKQMRPNSQVSLKSFVLFFRGEKIRGDPALSSGVQYSTVQYSKSTVQYSTVQYRG